MSDENENEPTEGTEGGEAPPTPVEETGEAKRLVRPTMLQVEGVVYCLEHTVVHDDTTDPYQMGYAECTVDEHRTVYYRGRKGDIDERVTDEGPPRRVLTLGPREGLTKDERELVVRLASELQVSAGEAVDSLQQILGKDSPAMVEVRETLDRASAVIVKLRGE